MELVFDLKKALGKAELALSDVDPINQITRDMAAQVQRKKDHILKQVISAHLGREDWKLDELKGRCECLVPGYLPYDKRTETYCVDGIQLVTFHPQTTSQTKENLSTYMHITFNCQLHIPCVIDMSEFD